MESKCQCQELHAKLEQQAICNAALVFTLINSK